MMRIAMGIAALALLAACEEPARSGYFDSVDVPQAQVDNYRRANVASLERPDPQAAQFPAVPPAPEPAPDPDAALAADVRAALDVEEPAPQDPAPQEPVLDLRPQGITNAQDFEAVIEQESIESDAARIAAARESLVVVEPQPLDPRAADPLPRYALAATNAVGERVYRRPDPSQSRAASRCRAYPSPDAAQRAFLAAGGPENDPRGMDPDGDGFVCGWSPEPFRAVLRAAQ